MSRSVLSLSSDEETADTAIVRETVVAAESELGDPRDLNAIALI